MTFSLGRCRVTVSPLFTGMITLMLLIDTTGMMSLFLGAMLLHEAGHLLFMALFGCLPKQVLLLPFEVNIVVSDNSVSRYQQAFISAGGILANLFSALLFSGRFQMVNLFLAVFSALPIFSMDGYQLIELACSFSAKLRRIPIMLSLITIVSIGGVGIWMLLYAQNPMLILFCLYMGMLEIRSKRQNPMVEK